MSMTAEELVYSFAIRQFHKAPINTERELMCVCSDFANEFLTQPLTFRMTEEEKERVIRTLNMYYGKWREHPNESTEAVYCAIKETFEAMFGKRMFAEKGGTE